MIITVETILQAPISKVWDYWTRPEYIVKWNFASQDWHCPTALNDLQAGAQFNWRMEAKDGSMGFDFIGTYIEIKEHELITYKISDGRKVEIRFSEFEGGIKLSESFEAEGTHSDEMQRQGWQSILGHFKEYVETS